MVELEVSDIRLRLCFSFFAVIALAAVLNDSRCVIISLFACFLHETGHIAAMTARKVKPLAVTLYGGGIKITPHTNRMLSFKDEIIIYAAGPIVNLVVFLVLLIIDRGTSDFASVNLFLFVLNILPARYLDGGQIFSILRLNCTEQSIIARINVVQRIIIGVAIFTAGYLMLCVSFSISLAVTLFYLIFCEFML